MSTFFYFVSSSSPFILPLCSLCVPPPPPHRPFLQLPSLACHYLIVLPLSSPFSDIHISPPGPYLSHSSLSICAQFLICPFFSHGFHSPRSLSPRLYPGCFPSFPTLPSVPVAVPQAVGCGGRWLAGWWMTIKAAYWKQSDLWASAASA